MRDERAEGRDEARPSRLEDKRATSVQEAELKRLTLALCKPGVNNVARIAAIQRRLPPLFADSFRQRAARRSAPTWGGVATYSASHNLWRSSVGSRLRGLS